MTKLDANLIKHVHGDGLKLLTKMLVIASAIPVIVATIANQTLATEPTFVAGLTGSQEAPVVDTNSTGTASFVAASNGSITYLINVTAMTNVTQAEVNLAEQGKNGPIILTLFSPKTPLTNITGVLSQGNISSANLEGPMDGKQLSSLRDIMQQGSAYVNIRTTQNPNGEIRGQLGFAGIDESGTNLGEQKVPVETEEKD
jgi:CHRD domain